MGTKLRRPNWIGQDATTAEAKRRQLLEERPGIARAVALLPGILKRIAKEPELLKQGPDAVAKAIKERLKRKYIKRYGQIKGLKPIVNLQKVPAKELQRLEAHKASTKGRNLYIKDGHELFDSDAFRVIKHAPTLQVLSWSLKKLKWKRIKNQEQEAFVNEEPIFSFTYDEAVARGLKIKEFTQAIRILVEVGFWDIEKYSSNWQRDYSLYRFSERWRKYGQADFQEVPFPKRGVFGYYGRPHKT